MSTRQILIGIGSLLIAIGVVWPWVQKFGLFRLPGDIVIEREHFRVYLPITSMILISLVISMILWLFRK
jgi:hypothetical protein